MWAKFGLCNEFHVTTVMSANQAIVDEPGIRDDRPDDNPIYLLEIRQTRRNFLLYAMLLGGILAGAYLFLIVFEPGDFWWDEFPLLAFPLSIYAVCIGVIPIYTGQKLASQQVDGDLILQTPLRSFAILWGKLQVAMMLSIAPFAPSWPGAIALLCQGQAGWIPLVAAGPLVALFVTMIALGFMAAAKTNLLRGGMIFLCGVFALGNAPTVAVLVGSVTSLLFYTRTGIELGAAVTGLTLGITMLGISALLMWGIGLALLRKNNDLTSILCGLALLAFVLLPILFLVLLPISEPWLAVLASVLLDAIYFAPPMLAVFFVKRHFDKHSV